MCRKAVIAALAARRRPPGRWPTSPSRYRDSPTKITDSRSFDLGALGEYGDRRLEILGLSAKRNSSRRFIGFDEPPAFAPPKRSWCSASSRAAKVGDQSLLVRVASSAIARKRALTSAASARRRGPRSAPPSRRSSAVPPPRRPTRLSTALQRRRSKHCGQSPQSPPVAAPGSAPALLASCSTGRGSDPAGQRAPWWPARRSWSSICPTGSEQSTIVRSRSAQQAASKRSFSSVSDSTLGTGTRWRRRNRPTSPSTPPSHKPLACR